MLSTSLHRHEIHMRFNCGIHAWIPLQESRVDQCKPQNLLCIYYEHEWPVAQV